MVFPRQHTREPRIKERMNGFDCLASRSGVCFPERAKIDPAPNDPVETTVGGVVATFNQSRDPSGLFAWPFEALQALFQACHIVAHCIYLAHEFVDVAPGHQRRALL